MPPDIKRSIRFVQRSLFVRLSIAISLLLARRSRWVYGIEVTGGSTGNLLQGNRVGKPGADVRPDEGIHYGAGSHNTVIRDNIAPYLR